MGNSGTFKKRLTKKQKIDLATKICNDYKKGLYSIEAVCDSFSVSYRTFMEWVSPPTASLSKGYIADVAVLYRDAKASFQENQKELLKSTALQSLMKRVAGYSYDEVAVETRKKVVKGEIEEVPVMTKVTTKQVAPSDIAIIFTLKNLAPEDFSDTVINKHEGGINIEKKAGDMTNEELAAEIARLESKDAKGKV